MGNYKKDPKKKDFIQIKPEELYGVIKEPKRKLLSA